MMLVVVFGIHLGVAREACSPAIEPCTTNDSHRTLRKVRVLVLGAQIEDTTVKGARNDALGADVGGVVVEVLLSNGLAAVEGAGDLSHRTRLNVVLQLTERNFFGTPRTRHEAPKAVVLLMINELFDGVLSTDDFLALALLACHMESPSSCLTITRRRV